MNTLQWLLDLENRHAGIGGILTDEQQRMFTIRGACSLKSKYPDTAVLNSYASEYFEEACTMHDIRGGVRLFLESNSAWLCGFIDAGKNRITPNQVRKAARMWGYV